MAKLGDNLKKVLLFLLLLLIGGVVGGIIGEALRPSNPNALFLPENSGWILLLLIVPIYFLAIAIHEGGHALAGVSQKFDFRMYVVGPFMFEKVNNKWKFNWNKSFNSSGGLVLCLPKDDYDLNKRFSIFILGGPFASLISAVFCYIIFKLIGGTSQSYSYFHNIVSLLLLLYTSLSVLVFLMTIVPFSGGGLHSDGARFLRFQKGGDISKLEILVLTIFSKVTTGIRPRDYNEKELVEAKQLANKLEDKYEVYFDNFLFQNAFDKSDLEQAEVHLNNYIEKAEHIPEGFRGSLWLDAAFFYAYGKNDLEKAKVFFNQYKPSAMIPKAQVFATEASMLKVENKIEEMNIKIDKALAEIPAMIDVGVGKAIAERLVQMRM